MSSTLRSMSISSESVNVSPSRPDVSMQVCRPSSLQRRKIRTTNGRCSIGSPPESVTPPLLILSTCAYLPICCIARDTVTGWPLYLCHVSGLWQYWQRKQAAGEEADEADARTVHRAADLVRVHVADEIVLVLDRLHVARVHGEVVVHCLALRLPLARRAGARSGCRCVAHSWLATYIPPWNVRLMTSSCCSLVSLTKFTA